MGTEQLLKIEPEHELKFKGPFATATTAVLKLENPTSKNICFKIKTTAPKRYCVRPNAGILEPGSHLTIAVVLQPCDVDSSANKHKFMVQAIIAPDGEVNQDDLWKSTSSSNVMETKLRCTFEISSDATNNHEVISPPEEKVQTMALAEDNITEDYRLKQENVQLKDEVERLRRKLKTRVESGDAMRSATTPPSQSMLYVVLAIVILMVGLLAGKFAL